MVQQGVRVSQESYSIKKLEPLYGADAGGRTEGRRVEHRATSRSGWTAARPATRTILDLIEAYNQDDCVSNLQLRDWLEVQRAA